MVEGFKFGIGFVSVILIVCWVIYKILQDNHDREHQQGRYEYKYNKNEDQLYLLGKVIAKELREGKNLAEVAKRLGKSKKELLTGLKRLTVNDQNNKDIELYEKVSGGNK